MVELRGKVRVGTSGYSYFWNEGRPTPFHWYIAQGFPTVEVNSTFYRFPSPASIATWRGSPQGFDFSIKVHRSITHYGRLGPKALGWWKRFRKPFDAMVGEGKVAFWLFQMPPVFTATSRNETTLLAFLQESNLGSAAVLEFRDPSWWERTASIRDAGAAFCSVDAPGLPQEVLSLNGVVYLRLHGREEWYSYTYSEEELKQILQRVKRRPAVKRYIYLNNDHGMLPNGRFLMEKA